MAWFDEGDYDEEAVAASYTYIAVCCAVVEDGVMGSGGTGG